MAEAAEEAVERAIREHERELLDELNRRVRAVVPEGVSVGDAEVAMVAAMFEDPELKLLVRRVVTMAVHCRGFLHDRLEDRDDSPFVLTNLEGTDLGQMEIDIDDAFNVFAESTDEAVLISLFDSAGESIAQAAGSLIAPEAVHQDGRLFRELRVSQDGSVATIRIPVDSGTRCKFASDGTVTGELPDGSSWSVVYIDAQHD